MSLVAPVSGLFPIKASPRASGPARITGAAVLSEAERANGNKETAGSVRHLQETETRDVERRFDVNKEPFVLSRQLLAVGAQFL